MSASRSGPSALETRIKQSQYDISGGVYGERLALPDTLVSQNVEVSELDPLLLQERNCLPGEAALWRLRRTLHEQDDFALLHYALHPCL